MNQYRPALFVSITIALLAWLLNQITPSKPPRSEPLPLPENSSLGQKNANQAKLPPLASLPNPAERKKTTDAAISNAPIIQTRTLAQETKGHQTKQKLVQWHGKYPLLRVEEDYEAGSTEPTERRFMVADHLIVKRRPEFTHTELLAWIQSRSLTVRRQFPNSDLYLIALPSADLSGFDSLLTSLNEPASPIEYAEPDPLRFAASIPTDPLFPSQWALHNLGQTGGNPNVDVDAPEAWNTTRGNNALVVAVLDSGLDINHPDIRPNLWTNAAEIPNNNIDDDADGLIDNVNGWNFRSNSKDLTDSTGHGTHCSGVIGAVNNNASGISGIAPQVQLMPLVIMNYDGSIVTSDAVAAMNHAVAKRVFITSNSYGGTKSTRSEKAAIDAALAQGILVVCAAGNDYPAKNIDTAKLYPASYSSANIISVAATTDIDTRASFSNFGPANVDLGAPGVGILSTLPNGKYGYESGTSMACPLVAGACVLVKAAHPNLNGSDIKSVILNSVDPLPGLKGRVKTGGRLNAGRAVKIGAQPIIEVTKTELRDGKVLGANGNNDGILNAGEDVTVAATIKNIGPLTAADVTTRLTLRQTAGDVILLRDAFSWGTLRAGASMTNNTAKALPFLLRISPTAPPQQVTLVLTHVDSDGHMWTSETPFSISGSHTLSGTVTLLTGGKPVKGATISYSGPVSGTTLTATDGTYSIPLPTGTYMVTASRKDYEPSPAQQSTLPSSIESLNFTLGRSTLVALPAALSFKQQEQARTTQTFTLTNKGDLPSNITIQNSSLNNAIHPGFLNIPSYGAARLAQSALAPLPWQDGFESGTSSLVPSRYYEEIQEEDAYYIYTYIISYYLGSSSVVTNTAAVGRRSLHYRDPWFAGFDNGMQRRFAKATQPRYISYWVRPGSSTGTSGCFSLEDGHQSTPSKKWIWRPIISVVAEEGGKLSVNGSLPSGDSSVTFTPKAWHFIELRNINWTSRTFDYWVNGSQIKTAISFMNFGTSAARVHIYNNTLQGESWWDELRVLDQDDVWLSHTPNTITLAPGASETVSVTASSENHRPGVFKAQLNCFSNDPVRPVLNVPVTMTVTPYPNTAPVTNNLSATTTEDTPVTITLPAQDAEADPLTFYIATRPRSGKLMIGKNEVLSFPAQLPGNTITYLPPANRSGTKLESFSYHVLDYRLKSKTSTVTLNVTPVNDAPIAGNDSQHLTRLGPTTIKILANDYDVEGSPLTPTLTSQPTRGTAILNADKTLTYTPDRFFEFGIDQFSYRIDDGQGQSGTGQITIHMGQLESLDWPTFGGSNERNGSSIARLNDRPLRQQWSATLGTTALRQAAIVGERAFVSSANKFNEPSFVASLDLNTGQLLWKQPLPVAFVTGSVTVTDTHVYVTQQINHYSGAGILWCLDVDTGSVIWQSSFFGVQQEFAAPAAFGDDVIVLTSTDYVESAIRFDGNTGVEIQRYNRETNRNYYISEAPCISAGKIILPPSSGHFQSHDLLTGELTPRSTSYPRPEFTGPVLTALGKTVWTASPYSSSQIVLSKGTSTTLQAIDGRFQGIPASDGTVVCAINRDEFRASLYDQNTLKLLRTYPTSDKQSYYQPLLLADAVLLSDTATSIFVFNRQTAQLLQRIPVGGFLSVGRGFLLASGYNGTLTAWTAPESTAIAPVASAQTVTGTEDTPLVITLSGTDANMGTRLTSSISNLPPSGTLWQTADGVTPSTEIKDVPAKVTHPAARVILVPTPNAFGTAQTQFEFRVHDGRQFSLPARITVNLAPTPDSPIAVNDRLFVNPDQTTVLRPLANDLEPDGEVMQITSLSPPDFGSVTLNADSSVRVLCNAQDYGRSFVLDYVVSDTTGRSSQATLTVVVAGPRPDEWPYPDNTAGNLRYYPGTLGESGHSLRWSYPLNDTVVSAPPIIAEGNVFVVMSSSVGRPEIRAIDLITGAEKWRVPMPGPAQLDYKRRYCPYISYANGALFVLDGQSTMTQPGLVCLDAADGSLRWRRDEEKLDTDQPLRIAGSLVIALARNEKFGVVAYNVTDGSKVWNYTSETSSQSLNRPKTGISQENLFTITGSQFNQHSLIDGSIVSSRSLINAGDGASDSQISYRDMVLDHGLALLYRRNPLGISRMYAVDVNSPPAAGYSSLETSFNALPVSVDSSVLVPTLQSTIRVLSPTLQDSGISYPAVATGNSNNDMDLIVAKDVVLARINSGLSVLRRSDRQITHTFSRPNMTISEVCAASGRIVAYTLPSNPTHPSALDCYSAQIVGNQPPIAMAQTLTLAEEGEVTLNLNATDADANPLLYSVLSLPAKGTLYQTNDGTTRGAAISNVPALVTNPSGRLIFVGSLDGFGAGAGSFTFAAFDPSSSSSTAEVTINITAINDPPVAVSDSITLLSGKSLTAFIPQANDRDYDGDLLTIVTTSTPTHGTVTLAPDRLSLTYTPELGYINGSDSFDYTIRDAEGVESTATVFIEINSFGAPWMTDRANPWRNSFVPTRLGPSDLQLRWSGKLPASLDGPTQTVSSPIVANDHFFVTDSSDHLIALSAKTGSQIWRAPIGSLGGAHNHSWNSSRLYLLNSKGQLQAFNDNDGSSIWSFQLPALPNSSIPSPAVVSAGIYVAAGSPSKVYQISPLGTAGFSSASINADVQSNLIVHDGSILTSTLSGITSFNAASGTTQWSIGSSELIRSNSLCCGDQNIVFYVTSHPQNSVLSLNALDTATQQLKWQTTLRQAASYSSQAPVPSTAHQAVFAQSGSQVIMFDASTGRNLRTFPLPPNDDALIQGPIITADSVIAATQRKIYIFNLQTTTLQQTISISHTCVRIFVAEDSLFAQTTADVPFQCYSQVDPTNASPSALPITLSANEDAAVRITLAGSDAENDPLSYDIITLPLKGKLYQTTDGTTLGAEIRHSPARVTDPLHRVIYQPPPDHFGTPLASFTFRVADGNRLSNPATVTLNYNNVNDAPSALSDAISAQAGQVLSPLPILGNDYDPDLDSLEIVSFSQPSSGTLSQNADGSLRYQAPASITPFSSTTFTYTIQDPSLAPASAIVSIKFNTHPDNSWPMHAKDNRRSSYAPGAIRGTGWTERWRVPTGTFAISLVADDTQAYITTSAPSPLRTLEARSLATGALNWNRSIAAAPLSVPLVTGGSIYLQSGAGSARVMEAYSTTTGLTQWTSNLSVPVSDKFFLSPLIYNNQLIAPGSTHYLRMSLETGVQNSSRLFATGDAFVDRWTPSLNRDSLIFHAVGKLHVDSLDSDSQWSIPLSGASDTQLSPKSVATAGNLAFAIDNSKKLTCINLNTRTIVWSSGSYRGLPALRGNEIYANFDNGFSTHIVHALSVKDGSLLRTYNTGTWIQNEPQPVVTDNLLIAQSAWKISFFDRQTGTLLQSISPNRELTSRQPILAGETLLTVNASGEVIAYTPPNAITFSPASGTFSSPQNITLTAIDVGATIHYTTDGSAPNLNSNTVANGSSVIMASSGTLRAIAVQGSKISRIIEANYTIGASASAKALAFSSSPSSPPVSTTSANSDFDSDGMSDLAEAVAGTDPRNPSDFFKITNSSVLETGGTHLRISWSSKVGRNYRVQCSDNLQDWVDVSGSLPGTGAEISHQLAPPTSGPCFLRVRIE